MTRCEWGWDKRLRLGTAFWTRETKPTEVIFHNSPTTTPAMWEKPRATSWSCKSQLACYTSALSTTSQVEDNADKALSPWKALSASSLHEAFSMGWWSTLVIATHENRDKCTGNLECWGEDWVTTGETGFSTCHLHISSEEGWPPVLKALGATNLQWSKAWWHKPSRPTLQTLHCQLTSGHSQPLSFLLAKVY